MGSNSYSTGLHMSGNLSADCTLLITDLFELFPSSFRKLIPLLETRYRVISITDTGFDIFNRTKTPRHENMEGFAKDLVTTLRDKEIKNVTYLAHSVNAMLAFYAAIEHPQLFDKLVLLSGIYHLKKDLAKHYLLHDDAEFDNNLLFDNLVGIQQRDENPEQLHSLLAQAFMRMNPDKARLIFNIITSADCRWYLEKLSVPVMILQGTGDRVVTGETAYFMHRHIQESYLVKTWAKGHLPQLNAPEEIFQAMEIFLHPAVC